jgi:prepilin-type N-terminal cleavage/methylation domain-containing protein
MKLTGSTRPRGAAGDGFTLIEVMVAMAILAIGLLAVAAAQLGALHLGAKSRNLTVAMHLAQEKMEEFQALPAASLPATGNDADNPIDPDPDDNDETTFNRRWEVLANTPVTNVSTLRVRVDWVEPKTGMVRTTTIESMKAQ